MPHRGRIVHRDIETSKPCDGLVHQSAHVVPQAWGKACGCAAFAISSRSPTKAASLWRGERSSDQPGKRSPNIGSPLTDSACVASSWRTSQCSGELAVFETDDVGGDPGGRAAVARETTVGDDVVALGHDEVVLVAQRLRSRADEVEQSRAAWRDMGAVLDVAIGPEPLGGGVVALVEQRLECFEDKRLVLF